MKITKDFLLNLGAMILGGVLGELWLQREERRRTCNAEPLITGTTPAP